jgi:hypothetical protein
MSIIFEARTVAIELTKKRRALKVKKRLGVIPPTK